MSSTPSAMLCLVLLALFATPADAFRVPLARRQQNAASLRATVDVSAEELPVSAPKRELLDILDSYKRVMAGDAFNRPEVLELLLKLEPMNPTEDPAYSEKLVGSWELRYDGGFSAGLVDSPTREIALFVYAGGYAPSLLLELLKKLPGPLQTALEVDSVTVDISDDLSVMSTTEVFLPGGRKGELGFSSRLLAETPARLSESFSSAKLFGRSLDLPGPLAFMRRFIVSYVDDDLMIIRDESGKPEILTKKPLDASMFDGGVVEDMEKPEIDPMMSENLPDDATPSDAA
eukprot:scaffold588_cov247-Pinguiococcus_pyrenoidosus.AAC.5